MQRIFNNSILAGVALIAFSCSPELDAPTPGSGSLDFTRYVAYGNSLTAGYADGGLYLESQLNSYPFFISQQLKAVGGGNFEQPLFPADKPKGSGYLSLTGFTSPTSPTLTPTAATDPQLAVVGRGLDNRTLLYSKYIVSTSGQTTPQNLGIPGIRVADITTGPYGVNNPVGFNPYFERLSPSGLSYTQYAKRSNATFFTSWLGNNDVLGFASAGGDVNNDGNTDLIAMTEAGTFKVVYQDFLDSVTRGKTVKGLLANIPNVTDAPFFTTVKPSQVVALAKLANPAVDGLYIVSSEAPTTPRKATDEDLVLLTTQANIGRPDSITIPGVGKIVIPHGFNAANPLRNNEVLDKAEVAAAATRTAEINTAIAQLATDYNLALWNSNTFLGLVRQGKVYTEGVQASSSFISGGVFSLDGVHLTPRGYAIVANEMIKAINAKYGSTIPTFAASQYRGVVFPN